MTARLCCAFLPCVSSGPFPERDLFLSILELFIPGLRAASALADEKMMMSTNKIF